MKQQFEKLKEKYPNLSDCMIFVKMVEGKKITKFELRKWFDKLVPRTDYQGTPKEEIISWLIKEIIKK